MHHNVTMKMYLIRSLSHPHYGISSLNDVSTSKTKDTQTNSSWAEKGESSLHD